MRKEYDMEITLEKIELVKDRTGVSYKEAKEALEAADGSVVDAIINIEETINLGGRARMGAGSARLLEKIKAAVRKGNVSRILVKKDGETLLNLPVNVGILGTVLAPWAAVAGVIAAFGTKCEIELIKDDGQVVEISEIATDAFGEVVERGADFVDEVRERGADVIDSVRAKTQEAVNKSKKAADADEAYDSGADYDADAFRGETGADYGEGADEAEAGYGDYVSTAADEAAPGKAEGEKPAGRVKKSRAAKPAEGAEEETAGRVRARVRKTAPAPEGENTETNE
jgi:hypothetical protein